MAEGQKKTTGSPRSLRSLRISGEKDKPAAAGLPAGFEHVQPHGLVLVMSEPDLVIRQVSQNANAVLGRPATSLLGLTVDAALGRAQRAELEKTLRAAPGLIPEHSLRFQLMLDGQERPFNAFTHRRDGQLVLELEPARRPAPQELSRLLNQATAALAAIECTFDMHRLQALAVRSFAELTGYRQVVLYRMDEEGNSHVLAECCASGCPFPSLQGQVISLQDFGTGTMFARNGRRLREVRDLRARLAMMTPKLNPVTGGTLSLRHAFLRGTTGSRWRQHLQDLGVRGTVRLALQVDGRVWGMLAGHHDRPRSLSRTLRRVCIDLGQALSRQVVVVQQRAASEHHLRLTAARDELLAGLADGRAGFPEGLGAFERSLLAATNAHGAALWWSGELHLFGRTPGPARTLALAKLLGRMSPYARIGDARLPAFTTQSMEDNHPECPELRGIAGVLAIPLGAQGALLWFRRPESQILDFALPRMPVRKPSPRRAPAWTPAEIACAQGFMQLGWMAPAHRQAKDTLASEVHLRGIIENLAHGVLIYSGAGHPIIVNAAAAQLYGLTPEQLLDALRRGKLHHCRADGSDLPAAETPMQLALHGGQPVNDFRMGIRLADGSMRWSTVSCRRVDYDTTGKAHRYLVVSLHDVSEQQRIERDLQLAAHFDPLTGMPNRALFKERLEQSVAQSGDAAQSGRKTGVIIIGLDRFKEINDTLGTLIGDQVLQEVGHRLSQLLGNEHVVARFGGDEFAVLAQATGGEAITAAASRSRDALDMPARIDGNEIFIGCSVGLSIHPDDGASADQLLRHADIALNEAKAEGGNSIRVYSQELQVRSSRGLSLAAKLHRALERGELHIAYQPQVDLASGQVLGLEALMRWDNPELGAVPPAQFIRVAEETGLILPMGEWLLRTACAQNRAWQAAGLPAVTMAVNLSARQFRDRQLAQKVADALSRTGLDARWLEFEITEGVIMQDIPQNTDTLEQLVSLGAKVAIDDFGTGYSSLAYLKRFPVHMLKIDRAFVRDISTDRDDAAIVRTIIALAHSLELGVIAEGVETEQQLRFLAQLNCDRYQGYYFSRPVAAAGIPRLLQP